MGSCHLCCLLVSITLIFVCCVSASPEFKDPIIKDGCPTVLRVGEGYSLAHITLQESFKFHLKPNTPRMLMKFLADDEMFAITVDGTMVKLLRCNVEGLQCAVVEEGATKSNTLLVVNAWNSVKISYYNGEINVNVNDMSRVKSSNGKTNKGRVSFGGKVTFLVPLDSHNYNASVYLACDDPETRPKIQTEIPVLTPTTTPISTTEPSYPNAPYEGCPVYQVEVNHPSTRALLYDNLTLAVFPTHPNLLLTISDTSSHVKQYMKVHLHDFTGEIYECVEWRGKGCDLKYRISTIDSIITPEKWNDVTLSIDGDLLAVDLNGNKKIITAKIPSHYLKTSIEVIAEAPRDLYSKAGEYYVAYVNVKCDVVEQEMVWPKPSTPRKQTVPTQITTQGIPTKAPIVEVTTEAPTPTGISRDIAIVVGVLVGIIVIIALAILITTIKKRRSAAITERSPLQNQFQQQQE